MISFSLQIQRLIHTNYTFMYCISTREMQGIQMVYNSKISPLNETGERREEREDGYQVKTTRKQLARRCIISYFNLYFNLTYILGPEIVIRGPYIAWRFCLDVWASSKFRPIWNSVNYIGFYFLIWFGKYASRPQRLLLLVY